MSNVGKIYKGEIGVEIKVEIGVDASGAATKQLICLRPDGTTKTWSATYLLDGTKHYLTYTTVTDDFNTDGNYELMAKCIWTSPAQTLYGSTAAFRIYPLYD